MSEDDNQNATPGASAPEQTVAESPQPPSRDPGNGATESSVSASENFTELEQDNETETTLGDVNDFSAVYNVPVQISAVLGRAVMPVSQLLKLGRGAVVELDRRVGESVDIYVNNRLVARGEVVIVDERLGITMTEIIKSERQ